MVDNLLGALYELTTFQPGMDWKADLDGLIRTLRRIFIFDNVAIYIGAAGQDQPEVVYARAVGRGRRAEADASWGEDIANQVISTRTPAHRIPADASDDRVKMPYLLGLPLALMQDRGALIFIRFGGPAYEEEHIQLAGIAAVLISRFMDRRILTDIQSQLDYARQQAQFQDDFVAMITHDLHTPLGFIKGYATSLLRSDASWDANTRQEFLMIIDEETDHLIHLIERLLDSARLQHHALVLDIQPLRVDSLIRDVVTRLLNRHPELKVDLDLETTPPIRADGVRLTQVIENLFENAMKYAPGTPIRIQAGGDDQEIRILFSDRGPGIPAAYREHIFERFYRIPGRSEKRGTGLGLFICRELIRAHRGTIAVVDSDHGAAFEIRLPVQGTVSAGKSKQGKKEGDQ